MLPTLDKAAAKTLGEALRGVAYNEEAIEELLGEEAWSTALEDVPVHERRLPQSPLATAIRLFFLELPVTRADAERALGNSDVGAGNGVHALLAAGHSERVVATDVNPRALAFTELNAALSGLDNVECRRGSLFEPVTGEQFDLITCNAPYVVSPERRWAYRDSGLQADEVSERVVRDAAANLSDGGFATLLVSWLAQDEDEPDERVLECSEETGCDSWILPTCASAPLTRGRPLC